MEILNVSLLKKGINKQKSRGKQLTKIVVSPEAYTQLITEKGLGLDYGEPNKYGEQHPQFLGINIHLDTSIYGWYIK